MDASLTTAWEKNPKQPNLGAESDRGDMMVAKDRGGNGLNGGHGEGGDDGDMRGWRRWRYEKVETRDMRMPWLWFQWWLISQRSRSDMDAAAFWGLGFSSVVVFLFTIVVFSRINDIQLSLLNGIDIW